MNKTTFKINKMDCPSEEQIIRMKLNPLTNIVSLEFNISERLLYVFHTEDYKKILQQLNDLNFNTVFIATEFINNDTKFISNNYTSTNNYQSANEQYAERKTLWSVLIINFTFFVIEFIMGLIANSMGLIADSLDMLADSIVYGLALIAVGATMYRKRIVSKFAGYFQFLLAIIGLIEVVRRFVGIEQMPDFMTMIYVSIAALAANIGCLLLLLKNKSKEIHIRATMIFTSNDIIINVGVIISAVLVHLFHTVYPDLIIGAIVFIIVTMGAYRILRLAK